MKRLIQGIMTRFVLFVVFPLKRSRFTRFRRIRYDILFYGTLDEIFAFVWKFRDRFLRLFAWIYRIMRVFVWNYWIVGFIGWVDEIIRVFVLTGLVVGFIAWTDGLWGLFIRTETHLTEINFLFEWFLVFQRFEQMKIGLDILFIVGVESKRWFFLRTDLTDIHGMWSNIMDLNCHFRATWQNIFCVKICLMIIKLINVRRKGSQIIVTEMVCGWS